MGLFTSVYKKRKCDRCGVAYDCDFQFKTGEDFCDHFRDGDPAKGVPKGRYSACRNPLCQPCHEFVVHTLGWIARQSKDVILKTLPGVELVTSHKHRFARAVRLSGKTIGELGGGGQLLGDGISCQWFMSPKPSGPFQKIREALEACWKRHLKLTHLEEFAKVEYKKVKSWGFDRKDEYQLVINEDLPEWTAAIAVVDKTVSVVDNVENTLATLEEQGKIGPFPLKKAKAKKAVL